MCPRIPWEMVADLLGFAEHPLGTTAVDEWLYSTEMSDSCDEIFCLLWRIFGFSRKSFSLVWIFYFSTDITAWIIDR